VSGPVWGWFSTESAYAAASVPGQEKQGCADSIEGVPAAARACRSRRGHVWAVGVSTVCRSRRARGASKNVVLSDFENASRILVRPRSHRHRRGFSLE